MVNVWGGSWGPSWGTSWAESAAAVAVVGGDDAPPRRRERQRLTRQDIIRIVEMIEAERQAKTPTKARRKKQRRKIEEKVAQTLASSAPWASPDVAARAVEEAKPVFGQFLAPKAAEIDSAQLAVMVRNYMDEVTRIAREMQDAEDEELLLLAA